MKKNPRITAATEATLDRWALMEVGRKLHDRAVFEIFARCFTLPRSGRKERRTKTRLLELSLAHHRAR